MLIHMGTIDIDGETLRVTTSFEHLGNKLGDPDSAPPHPVAKKNSLVRSKSFLEINTRQDPTKEGGFHYLRKQISSYCQPIIVSVHW